MYWLVEEKEQLEILQKIGYEEVFIEVIPYSYNTHPTQNPISLVYFKPINGEKGYMLCINHSESFSLDINEVYALLKKCKVVYCRDKKETLHYFPLKALYDITPTYNTYIPEKPYVYNFFYQHHKDKKDINRIIPIVKHYEYCETVFEDLKPNNFKSNPPYYKWFNQKSSVVFSAIEASGLKVNKELFEQYFHPIEGDYVYTQYNLKTLTTRPSNSFNGVNYAALNKDNGARKCFIPRNSFFIEMDISAYHPTLLANLIGYRFNTMDIHSAFAEMYKVDYQKAKELTFKQLYGGVFEQYKDLEFFKKVKVYTDNLWGDFQKNGWIECPTSGYIYEDKGLGDMKPQKLLNYVLQNLETSTNVSILWEIFQLLRGKKTKLVLYTYDSFLFDWDENEPQLIEDIKKVFNKYELNIKINQGNDYDFE